MPELMLVHVGSNINHVGSNTSCVGSCWMFPWLRLTKLVDGERLNIIQHDLSWFQHNLTWSVLILTWFDSRLRSDGGWFVDNQLGKDGHWKALLGRGACWVPHGWNWTHICPPSIFCRARRTDMGSVLTISYPTRTGPKQSWTTILVFLHLEKGRPHNKILTTNKRESAIWIRCHARLIKALKTWTTA